MTEQQICEKAIDTFGKKSQLLKCAEKCNDLSKSIIKFVNGSGPTSEIEKGLAEVEITAKQIRLMLNEARVNGHKTYKLHMLETILALAGDDQHE